MIRRLFAILCATLILTAGGGASYAAPSQASYEVLALVNAERAKKGCVPLGMNPHLQQAADWHSWDMATHNYFSHTARLGGSVLARARAAGYGANVAENIAAGQRTPRAVVKAWMASPGHRRNILNCNYRATGISVFYGGSYGTYWTQEFGNR